MSKKQAFVLLDESGSMTGQEQRVCSSMNEYVAALPKDARITVFKFDSRRNEESGQFAKLHYEGKVSKWRKMTGADYRPGAMTPLYDSIAQVIQHAKDNTSKGDKVMVMIDTDGFENHSTDYSLERVKTLIEKRQAKGWKFQFMSNALTEHEATQVSQISQQLGANYSNAAAHTSRSMSYARAASHTTALFEGTAVPDDKDTVVVR